MQSLEPVIAQTKETITLNELYDIANKKLIEDPRIGTELTEAQNKLDRVFNGLRQKYPNGTLDANAVNRLKVEANQRRSDYSKATSGDPFITDVYATLARSTNEWLNGVIPDELFKQSNAEWSKLQRVIETANVLQNQQVDVGLIGRALGSYVTTVAGSTAGLSVGGPGGLVIAGILAKIGGDKVADMMRNVKFSPVLRDKIRTTISSDAKLKEKLIKTASPENQRYLSLPSATKESPRSATYASKPIQQPVSSKILGTAEQAKEGAIKIPTGEGAPLRRGLFPALDEAELRQLKSETFKKVLENAGVDAESAIKAISAGAGAYLLMTYMGEDGSILPAGLAILSVMPNKAKLNALDEALKINALKRSLVKDGSASAKNLDKANKELVRLKQEELGKGN